MPAAIADGWLLAIGVALFPVAFAIAKAVANRWRVPLEEYKTQNTLLQAEAVKRSEELTNEKINRKVLEARLESCQAELDHWRTGIWRAPQ